MRKIFHLSTLSQPSYITRCRMSKALLYVLVNPFSNLNEIYDSGIISKKWHNLKLSIDFLVKHNIIQSAKWWSTTVYFVKQYLDPEDQITANHLLLKEKIFHFIESNEMIRNSKTYNEFVAYYGLKDDISKMPKGIFEKRLMFYQLGLDSTLLYREQILWKFIIIYFQMIKIMLLEYHKDKKNGTQFARYNKDWREREVVTFLGSFLDFLGDSEQGLFLSKRFSSYQKVSDYLDDVYDDYQNYYNRLIQNAIPFRKVFSTFYQTLLQTKKDTSENEEVTMKQISNRMRPFQKDGGEPDIAKMYREGQVESGMGIFYPPDREAILFDLSQMRKALRLTPRGPEYERIKKDAELLFPGITFD